MKDTDPILETEINNMPKVDDLIKQQDTDAMKWALAFKRIIIENEFTIDDMKDESYMVGWFANAMMTQYDWIQGQKPNKVSVPNDPEGLQLQCKIECEWDMGFKYIYDNYEEAVRAVEEVDWTEAGYETWQEVEADGLLSIEEL